MNIPTPQQLCWEFMVRAGAGQVVTLVGPPGMGKTRLLTEFGRSLPPDQATWALGQCLAYGQAMPYLPVRDLVQHLCLLVADDSLEMRTAAVRQRLAVLGNVTEEDVALVLQLLDLPVAPERLAHLTSEARQARTFTLLWHLLRHEAQRQPLVLAVENVHWIDPTSEAWLAFVVERLAGTAVLLLLTQRPGYQPPWGARGGDPIGVAAPACGGQPGHRGGGAGHGPALGGPVPADCGAWGRQSVFC